MKKYVYALDLSQNSTGVCIFTNDGQLIKVFTIDTNSEKETKLKLKIIGNEFKRIAKEYPPERIIIEQGFTLYNPSTQAIFRVHGLVNFLFADFEQIYYPASTVKKIVGGKGNMTKEEIYNSILKKYPKLKFNNYDESDAYAVGLTYFLKEGIIKGYNNATQNISK
jgi:Holliday junction resolvasome RuvABC endonuclease subunit